MTSISPIYDRDTWGASRARRTFRLDSSTLSWGLTGLLYVGALAFVLYSQVHGLGGDLANTVYLGR